MQLSDAFNQRVPDDNAFYHFTTDIGYRAMQGETPQAIVDSLGAIPDDDKKALLKELARMTEAGPGLQPANFFVQGPRVLSKMTMPRKGRSRVIEGLLEPAPESWTNTRDLPIQGSSFYEYFIDTMTSPRANIVKKYAKEYKLLKVSRAPEDDVQVADIAELVKDFAAAGAKSGPVKAVSAVYKGAKKYWASLAPFAGYREKEAPTLPVVICWTPIPPERLEVVQSFSVDETKQLKNLHWQKQPGQQAPKLTL